MCEKVEADYLGLAEVVLFGAGTGKKEAGDCTEAEQGMPAA